MRAFEGLSEGTICPRRTTSPWCSPHGPGLFGSDEGRRVTAGFQGQRIIGGRARLTGITLVLEAAMVPFAGLLAALERIPDPRRRQGRRYPLAYLLLFSVLAVLAGATSYRGILVF